MQTVPRPRHSAEKITGVVQGPRGARFLGDGGPYLIAARGGAGAARANTLAAFDASYALGLRYLQTDVRVTADGECVAVRGASLSRLTGVDARIEELTLTGIRRLGIGGDRVLRIADLLKTFDSARFVLDLKDPAALEPLVAVLQWQDAVDRVCLTGARDRWLAAARDLAGDGLTTALGWEATTRLLLAATGGRRPVALPPAEFVHLPVRLGPAPVLTPRVVRMAHDLGMRVVARDVENIAQMHAVLDAGVDGLATSRPDLGRAVLLARDAWQPPRAWHPPVLSPPITHDRPVTAEAVPSRA